MSAAVAAVALPAESGIVGFYRRPDLADAYAVALPPGTTHDPETLARFVLERQPPWIGRLMKVRDAIVSVFGLKTARALARPDAAGPRRIHIFRIYETHPGEIILGEDDSHLDFRLSVLCRPAGAQGEDASLVLSTVVQCHNLLGRAYIFVIAPFHRLVVRASLRRAAEAGWPKD